MNLAADPSFAMWATLQGTDTRGPFMAPARHHSPPMPPLFGQRPSPPQTTTSKSNGRPEKNREKIDPPAAVSVCLNNLDTVSLQKGQLNDMSEQQRRILAKLESGWKGTVEELMEAVK